MSWETVTQIVTIIAALAISPIMLVIFTNLMSKRIDDLRATMSAEHDKLYNLVSRIETKLEAINDRIHEIDKRLSISETKQSSP